ncbi:hypothetical protein Dimus_038123 [Dionaea muscipula]
MNLSCWNIRGFNKALKQEEMKKHLHSFYIDIMAVLETKIRIDILDSLMRMKFPTWRGDITSVQHLLDCLDRFAACSGLQVNKGKSKIYWDTVEESIADRLLEVSGF